MPNRSVLIRRGKPVEDEFALTPRQQTRLIVDGKISHCHPTAPDGQRGPCFLFRQEIEDLIERTTVRAQRDS